jgi:hypothetical protein
MRFYPHNRGPVSTRRLRRGGFTAFFAVLVSALALAIGLSIYDLLLRELTLSQTARDSQSAIFAADTGVECALYWDNKATLLNGSPSVFGTSSVADSQGGQSWSTTATFCNSQNILLQGPLAIDVAGYSGCVSNAWCKTSNVNAATTTFSLILNPNGSTGLVSTTT